MESDVTKWNWIKWWHSTYYTVACRWPGTFVRLERRFTRQC